MVRRRCLAISKQSPVANRSSVSAVPLQRRVKGIGDKQEGISRINQASERNVVAGQVRNETYWRERESHERSENSSARFQVEIGV